jgi:MFS transporter, AAHS family, benzoate transport protein
MGTIDVSGVINGSKFSRFHGLLLFWCAVLVFFDGIEIGIIGPIATPLIKEWSLSSVQVGELSSITAIGMIIGGLLIGPFGDRSSRKNIIIVCTFIYSFFTLMGAFSHGLVDFSIYRFMAGIGIGGIVPNALGLISDFSPIKNRSFSLTIATSSIAVGAMVARFIAIFLIPAFGWRSLFIVGAFPLLLLPFLFKALPESPTILFKKQRFAQLSNILNRVVNEVTYTANDQYQIVNKVQSKVPFKALFQNKLGISTSLIWLCYMCSALVSNGLSAWLPNLMVRAGYPLTASLLFSVVLGLGALVGSLTGGQIAVRIGLRKVTAFSFLLGGVALVLLSINYGSAAILFAICFITGWGTTGAQNLLLAYCSQFYPAEIRSTGSASAISFGKIGTFLGPLVIGVILTFSSSPIASYGTFAIISFIAALSLFGVRAMKENSDVNTNDESKINAI